MVVRKLTKPKALVSLMMSAALLMGIAVPVAADDTASNPTAIFAGPQHDGSHDFDFLIGDWKAHVRRLPDRLNGSHVWVEYDGISNHHKLLDTNANFEQFEVTSTDGKEHLKAQTLRMYNPKTRQWIIYGLDLDNAELDPAAPVVGEFHGNRGEFYNRVTWNGRVVLVRWMWLNVSPHAAHMEQSFSPDGKNWEVNWICDLSR
ncbi:hypothetical protein [Dyella sp. 2HG41-7]|uniref:hypothetical protein n=1 Tax=Dyella sp. 2HG41-7 TaxID=2883239 RepID=UPI001F3E3F7F|nr:hypothetical protein [Dyella sp. 2HG41-7]